MKDNINEKTPTEESLRQDVAYFMRRAYERGLTTSTGGNISTRLGSYMYITCSGKDKSSLSSCDIAKVNIETGDNLTPELKLSIESDMHRLIYINRKDVNAIMHSHPTYSCLFSASDNEIDTTLIAESWYLLDKVKTIPYERMGTKALAVKVSEAMKEGSAALLANHGAITLGKNLLAAFDRMECLEQSARMSLFSALVNAKGLDEKSLNELTKMR